MGARLKNKITEEPKEHYKMFKDGKQWVISGIVVFSAGMTFTMSPASVHGDTAVNSDETATTVVTSNNDSAHSKDEVSEEKTDEVSSKQVVKSTDQNVSIVVDNTTVLNEGNTTDTTTNGEQTSTISSKAQTGTEEVTSGDTTSTKQSQSSENSVQQSNENNAAQTTQTNKNDVSSTTQDVNRAQTTSTEKGTQSDPETDVVSADKSTTEQDHIKGNVSAAWEKGYQGQGMVVAVIDSGMDTADKDFRLSDDSTAKITQEDAENAISQLGYGTYVSSKFPFVYNYVSHDNEWIENDDSPHGAHVSGIIAANGQANSEGDTFTIGVAPEAQLLEMRVFAQYADEKADDIAKAIHDAVLLGANVIQMSLGIGTPNQQLSDIEQRAVQYAVDHGVFVSISASNNGNSGSILTDENGNPGSNQLVYQPVNSSTIADPGVSKGAMTVAAENSATGENDDMASFSSWGPLSDYSLKPDISAPGVDIISTVNDDQYESMSGTSMAGPYNAGAAALVMQELQSTTTLQGANLVKATKLALMNTATPMKDNAYGALVSPRRQGAGEINVGKAVENQVVIEGNNETGSVSLYSIGDQTKFSVTFTNLSDHERTYTFNDYGGPMTELLADDGTTYDAYLAGASVVPEQTIITVAANSTQTVGFTLSLVGLKDNEPVEGFLGFTSDDTETPNLVVPYLGYYGDLTDEQVFDSSTNQEDSIFSGSYFVNEENCPRGIADENSLKTLVNLEGNYDWSQVAKLYQDGKVAFSPNNDLQSDILKPYEFIKQNLQDLTIQILNDKGEIVRTLADEKGIDKSYYPDGGSGNQDITLSPSMRNDSTTLNWDGTLFDQTTGKSVVAPDGEYQYRFVGTLVTDGKQKTQTATYPVIIDTTAPTITNLSYDAQTQTLTASYADTGSGFTDYSYATLTINDQSFPIELNDTENGSSFTDAAKLTGQLVIKLTPDELSAFSASKTQLVLALSDVADNTQTSQLIVEGRENGAPIAVWNATNGLAFSTQSPDYNVQAQTYYLKGSAQGDFYINGKLVQVVNGEYSVPVNADSSEPLIFSKDAQENEVIVNWSTSTPKAEFAWQHVNGADQNWGLTVYGVRPNSRTFTVQALVSKGDNVKVYAQDYFTGTEYQATVKDGIATFTGELPEDTNEVLLVGWTEVDGPTYNDKQESDTNNISDKNYFGVVYSPSAADLPVLTSADQFGVTITNQSADPDTIGSPGDLPMHSTADLTTRADPNTSELTFDNVSDNDFIRYGSDAIDKGYYNPETKQFTVTGKVTDNVDTLTILGDDSDANAVGNQVKINTDNTFRYNFTLNNTEDRGVSYVVTNKDGSTTRGMFDIILDTQQPTLTVPVPEANFWTIDGNGNYDIYTNQPSVTITGQGDDNLDGYRMFVNDDNFYREYHNSGVNYIADFFTQTDGTVTQTDTNGYPAHDFSETYALKVANDQEDFESYDGDSDNVFYVTLKDQVGNTITKRIIVHYRPETTDTIDLKVVTPEFADAQFTNDRLVHDTVSFSTDNGATWQLYVGSKSTDGNYYQVHDKYGNEVAAYLVQKPVIVVTPGDENNESNTTSNETQEPGVVNETPDSNNSLDGENTEKNPGTTPTDTKTVDETTSENPNKPVKDPSTTANKTEISTDVDNSSENSESTVVESTNTNDQTKIKEEPEIVDNLSDTLVSDEASKHDTSNLDVAKVESSKQVLVAMTTTNVSRVQKRPNSDMDEQRIGKLPQTNEQTTHGLIGWIGSVMLAGLGILGLKRRKQE
ncbi:S8 family serine peptidase [Pediococcus ethanolidurans]|uniref:Cell-envelope associated proteinase n=1 Tax=Pediococcus ethanolidurans TaxID=319653 RepID=A0A0R2K8N6_9LACO|nr:S8 family serine peptidase [Pediococcus ethanolidurans]KRN83580.1 cell-envelope associated proteinase [Pediococcus ethanolidurans]GEN94065.1 peptidase S8 [Pediococcus ethanolidurans]SER03782.1 LPXTG-motif cell wall anchor domain-containing protein/KxYKxGKxW signal peptide containing protein [Pediococcus ethanolidurans]